MADRFGRRILLVGGPLVTAVGMTGSGLAVGIGDLLAWRFVAGAGSAFYMTGAQLYMMDISPPDRRGRNMAWNQGALLTGVAVGPAVGGLVAEFLGLRAPFFLVGITAVGAAVYSYFRLAEPSILVEDDHGEPEAPNWSFLRQPAYLSLCVISLALFATRAGARATLAPLIAYDELGLSEGEIGGILGLTALITVVLIGPAGDLGFLAAPPIMGYVADETSTDAALTGNAILLGGAAIILLLSAPVIERRARARLAG